MNYLEQIVAFHRWKEVNPLPASAIALWYELMSICNKAGWPTEFTVANAVLQSFAGLSKKEFDNARQLLINLGLINYKKSQRVNQAGKYSFLPFPIVQKGKQEGNQEGIQKGTQTEHGEGNGGGTLFKLNKTKPNETNDDISAGRDELLKMINRLGITCKGTFQFDELISFVGLMDVELVKEALRRSEKKSVAYALVILNGWNKEKIYTLEQLQAKRGHAQVGKTTRKMGNVHVLTDKLPDSIQRQMEREKQGLPIAVGEKQTVMDDPELRQLLESARKRTTR